MVLSFIAFLCVFTACLSSIIHLRYQGYLVNFYSYQKIVCYIIVCAVKDTGFSALTSEQVIRFLLLSQGKIVHAFS